MLELLQGPPQDVFGVDALHSGEVEDHVVGEAEGGDQGEGGARHELTAHLLILSTEGKGGKRKGD